MKTKRENGPKPESAKARRNIMSLLFGRSNRGVPMKKAVNVSKSQSAMFERVKFCLEKEQPFIDPDFNLEALCRMVLSNTTTVSNAINRGYGENFRKVINRYRAEYAHGLLVEDPCRDLDDVMVQSGFRSKETFKLSFFLAFGKSPKECRMELRFPGLRSPSSSKE